jgi:hypothetical protein
MPAVSARAGVTADAKIAADENVAARKDDTKTIEIVGIVPDIRASLFSKNRESAIYVPFAQGFQSTVQFHVRTAANTPAAAAALIDSVRREVRAAAPGVPMFKVRTFRQHLDASRTPITRIGAAVSNSVVWPWPSPSWTFMA